MITLKEIISCLAGVIVLSCVSHCRPNQNEKLVKTASAFAQDQTKLPEKKESTDKNVEIPVHLYYGVPAKVEEVDEDVFRRGRDGFSSDVQDRVRRRIQHFEEMIRPIHDEPSVWTSVTNVVEFTGDNSNEGRAATSRRLAKRDGLHVLRIKVRRGGVAIAGPGGVASAGTGGTAIVGPGGSAYTEEDGTAVVGPGAKLYQLPSKRGRGRSDDQQYKLIATGPFVFQPQPRRIEPQAFF